MAHGPRPGESAHRVRSHHTGRRRASGKSWRAFPGGLCQQRRRGWEIQHHRAQGSGRLDAVAARTVAGTAGGTEADHRGDEMSRTAVFRIWRGDAAGGKFAEYTTEVSEGMVVLDAVHKIQAEQAGDLACRWNCKAGKCGSC